MSLYQTRRSRRAIVAGVLVIAGGVAEISARHGVQVPWGWVPDAVLVRLLPHAESAAWREFTTRSDRLSGGQDLSGLVGICERTVRGNSDAGARCAAVALALDIALAGESSAVRIVVLALDDPAPSVIEDAGGALVTLAVRSENLVQVLPELIRAARGSADNPGYGRATLDATMALMTVKQWPCELCGEVAAIYRVDTPIHRHLVEGVLRSMAEDGCDITAAVDELERLSVARSGTDIADSAKQLAGSLRQVGIER